MLLSSTTHGLGTPARMTGVWRVQRCTLSHDAELRILGNGYLVTRVGKAAAVDRDPGQIRQRERLAPEHRQDRDGRRF